MSCPLGHIKQLRSELEELPSRMKTLPVDDRGYVIPWFVAWHEGNPEFRAMGRRGMGKGYSREAMLGLRRAHGSMDDICSGADVWNQSHVQRASFAP